MLKRVSRLALAGVALLVASSPGFTVPLTFHLMQIEQVIGGVNGDTSRQAIQLRQRFIGQNLVSQARIFAWDAAGANPILIVDMTTDVPNPAAGSRVLITTSGFLPGLTPDFVMTNPIPPSYLAAGKLTFEDDFGAPGTGGVVWSLAWGGASYTGTNMGTIDDDADGNFNPPFGSAMPSATTQAVFFDGAAADPSTNNLADYATTVGAATFTNNAGQTGTVPVDLMDFKVQ
jgi:hypothetical protein